MGGTGGLSDAQLASDRSQADPVRHEIAVYLRREMRSRIEQPFEDKKPLLVREGSKKVLS
jgi:hypothetical protein